MTVCKWLRMALICAIALVSVNAEAATTLLPNGKQCFSATTGITGMIGTTNTLVGGTLYTTGTYSNVPLTGGTGSTATATITVAGGSVTNVKILNPGIQYTTGDVLSAAAVNIGGTGSGFSITVASTAINGSLASGQVNMFIPSTTTPKATWQDSGQVSLNNQPILLDANGCAVIYGIGVYRQQLLDSLGNLVWDQLTTDTSAFNAVFWAGLAGGTPNAITVVDTGFNGTDGSVINFTALFTNTAATTLNPSGFGNIPVLKDTTSGPVALTGLEIVQGNPVSVIFRTIDNSFHILNPIIQSSNSNVLCGAIGLKITNAPFPNGNNIMLITADQVLMQTLSNANISRSSVSVSINTSLGNLTPTVGGMDGEVPGSSQWLNIYLIDNGTSPGGLASTNATSPSTPSGYTYKCRLGAVRIDNNGNLLRTIQLGRTTQYIQDNSTNNSSFPTIAIGNVGTSAWTAASVANFVPPTATILNGALAAVSTGVLCVNSNNSITIASCNNSAPTGGGPAGVSASGTGFITQPFSLVLQSSTIYWAGNNAGAGVMAVGWVDKVNAN